MAVHSTFSLNWICKAQTLNEITKGSYRMQLLTIAAQKVVTHR